METTKPATPIPASVAVVQAAPSPVKPPVPQAGPLSPGEDHAKEVAETKQAPVVEAPKVVLPAPVETPTNATDTVSGIAPVTPAPDEQPHNP